jgi:hypothetical protein
MMCNYLNVPFQGQRVKKHATVLSRYIQLNAARSIARAAGTTLLSLRSLSVLSSKRTDHYLHYFTLLLICWGVGKLTGHQGGLVAG